ncbi:Era-like GTP-binding protein [Methanofollis ethanolicus]|uniref:Era-like GTP-binding protein n=1 Tax=Methanofollis ethanolicus TaxID=488124 RepID=UPI0008299CBB|nr:Era-like GTP-binding protein [Methanofollis ethanolicus]
MNFLIRAKLTVSNLFHAFFRKKKSKIGIYGPPNAGKTTLANRIVRDWTGDAIGPVSEIPHETRRARRKENITISGSNGNSIMIDIVDTPGVTTKIDYNEFLEYGLEKDEAIIRAREATEGVAEAMHWLRDDIDGVIYMLDSTQDPFMQVNIMMIGIIESRKLPVVIVANKIDLPDAAPQRIRSAFPQHPVVPISGMEGDNIEMLYEKMAETFR